MKKNMLRLRTVLKQTGLTHLIQGIKLSVFFLFIFAARGYAENLNEQNAIINISKSDLTINELITEIEKQTSYLFIYSENDINLTQKVTVSNQNKEVAEILKDAFKSTDITHKFENNYISLRKKGTSEVQYPVTQQDKKNKIEGTVIDKEGIPVIGANVSVEGTQIGTVTDIDGKFTLEVPEKGIIIVSYIGYITVKQPVGKEKVLNIKIQEDTKTLDEIVVVGFGSQKKVNLTGAVSTVSSEVFEGRPVQNASMALQGVMPGLNVSKGVGTMDDAPAMNIRGMTTIGEGSNGNPLILIDGMEGDLNILNPQDIESVSLLKDAAASSIYGSRAPFGVLLITTKKGKTGRFTVNYNNSFRWGTPTKRPNTVDSYRFATYFNDAAENAKGTGKFTPERMQRIRDYMDGKITTKNIPDPNNPANWADGYDYANDNVDWWDVIYNDWTFAQEHTASISGGAEKLQVYASLNYLDSDGLLKLSKDTYNRYASTLKASGNISDYVRYTYGIKFARSDYDRPARIGNIGAMGYQTWPMLPVYDDNGYMFSSPSPALTLKEGGRDKTRLDDISQQLQVVVTPLKGWEIVGEVNFRVVNRQNHWDIQKTYNHNVAGDIIPNSNSTEVHESLSSMNYMNPNLYSTYSHAFENGHAFKVMLGFQSEQGWNNGFGATRNGVMVPGMDVIDITNGTDGSGRTTPPSVNGSRDDWAVAGFFGRLNYSWKDRYMIEGNLRRDGTSRFREDKRWKWFPSVSGGWNIAKEAFWSDFEEKVSTLKIRASYGVLGNQNTKLPYPTYVTMPVGTSNSDWLINGIKQNTANAPNIISSMLTRETVSTLNIGLDVDMLQNRLHATLEWYQRDTKDMVGPAPELPLVLGIGVPTTNNTDLRTSGWELNLSWRDKLANGFGYSATFNLSDDKTIITNYPNDLYDLGKYYTNQRVGEIWGYETVGIAKTQEEMDQHLASLPNGGQNPIGSQWGPGDIMYKDLNGDGVINDGSKRLDDHGDLKVLGNNAPRFRFGLSLAANWKGLDISALFQGIMKRDYWEGSYTFWGYSGYIWRSVAFEEHMDYFRNKPDHEMGVNLDSYYPRPLDNSSRNQQVQSRYLQKGSYIRLKNVQLGYSFPQQLVQRFQISGLRIFMSGENLWTGTKLNKIFDPEMLGYGAGSVGYPLSATLSAGININF